MRRWEHFADGSSTIKGGTLAGAPKNSIVEGPMQTICYFVGLDVHKQVIAYCVKKADGEIVSEGKVKATRSALSEWVKTLPGPWRGGMEATMFSHWIYRYLQPYALELRMGHPARMKAITAGKKKSDKIDARTIADLLRVNLFPTCFV